MAATLDHMDIRATLKRCDHRWCRLLSGRHYRLYVNHAEVWDFDAVSLDRALTAARAYLSGELPWQLP